MTRTANVALLGLLVVVSISGCNGRDELPINIASLEDELPKLEEIARRWRSDAYLVHATVELLNVRSSRSPITAYFQSPSTEFEGLLLFLEQDGSILSELVPHENPVRQTIPIVDADWQLDAAEALEAGLSEAGRRYLKDNSDSQCSFMILERDVPDAPERVVWRIELGGCLLDPSFQRIVVDANTGDVLKERTY